MRDLVIALFLLAGLIAKLRKPRRDVSLHSMEPRGAKNVPAMSLVLLSVAVIAATGEWLRPRMRRWMQLQFECQRFDRCCSRRIAKNA